MRALLRKPVVWMVLSVGLVAVIVGLLLFEPWRAFTHSRVEDPLPVAAAPTGQPESAAGTATAPSREPTVLAHGRFVSQEHKTTGAARVLELADGSRVLRLEGFSTSDGPDVHVWLSSEPAGGPDGSFDDGRHLALGELRATDGSQNYPIPAGAELAELRSAVIWCDRFNVAFGSAELAWA